jgi:hypothetical protein
MILFNFSAESGGFSFGQKLKGGRCNVLLIDQGIPRLR